MYSSSARYENKQCYNYTSQCLILIFLYNLSCKTGIYAGCSSSFIIVTVLVLGKQACGGWGGWFIFGPFIVTFAAYEKSVQLSAFISHIPLCPACCSHVKSLIYVPAYYRQRLRALMIYSASFSLASQANPCAAYKNHLSTLEKSVLLTIPGMSCSVSIAVLFIYFTIRMLLKLL